MLLASGAASLLASGSAIAGRPIAQKGLNVWRVGAVPQEVASARELGVGSIRSELPWQLVQPERDRFDWSRLDAAVDAAGTSGAGLLLTLRSVSSWGTRLPPDVDLYHHASAPREMADWERFVGALAARYKGRGVDYEIENEVNASFWGGSPEDYLELLKASRRAIQAADPGARVLCSAMACGIAFDLRGAEAQARFRERSDRWLLPILRSGAFDVVSVHDCYFPTMAERAP